jgi:glycerophosphoryl diester phosphodiesterase
MDSSLIPLLNAFAHSDCYHPRPLFDALEHGFCGIEADVYRVDGEILVGHDPEDLVPGRTLESLYLDPLMWRVQENGGHVFPSAEPVTLLVDLKDEGHAIYELLKERLRPYQDMLFRYESGQVFPGPVMVLLSGDRPVEVVRQESCRLVFIDGRLPDLDDPSQIDPQHMPWVSDNYSKLFTWDGSEPISDQDRTRISGLCNAAHSAGARFRFWETPERVEVWETLLDLGIDLISTDDLGGLAKFLRERIEG